MSTPINIPRAFEAGLAAALWTHSGLGNRLPRMRTWQAIDADQRWTPSTDRTLPMIDIRCGPPRVDPEDGVTLLCNIAVLIATSVEDDETHSRMAEVYAAVQACLDALYAEFRAETSTGVKKTFDEAVAAVLGAGTVVRVGGLQHGEPMDPYEEAGANFIGLTFIVHFSRSDY